MEDTDILQGIHTRILGVDYDYIYCQSGPHVVNVKIPVRDYKELRAKGGGNLGDFEVNYTGFTQEAQDAFQYAVNIWDMLLDSDAKIVVDANFADLNSGTLGSAAPTAMYADFSTKVDQHIEFAAPLAEKIIGRSLNGAAADLSCNFNRSANWFYDFNNPDNIADNQTDFVSVVLHELGHGLGFLSRNSFASDNSGFIRAEKPLITDIFSLLLELGDGTNLILNLEEASSSLGTALTSGDLFLNSHSFTQGSLPEIFAPRPWRGGSSLSHLDETVYNSTDPLMTPSIGTKEIIHDPQIAVDMMNDMGWRSSFILHRSANVELVNQPVPITVEISTDVGVGFDSTSVLLVFSQDSFRVTSDTLFMTYADGTEQFSAQLPMNNRSDRYQYYIALADNVNKGYSSPLLAPRRYHNIQVGLDVVAPTIEHTPLEFFFLNEGEPTISATVFDSFSSVDTVILDYRIDGGEVESVGLNKIDLTSYELVLDLDLSNLLDGDVIEYRLRATDSAIAANTQVEPENGFYSMIVKDVPAAVEFYENNFEGSKVDFSLNRFSIDIESGFDGIGLHTEHPYQNAGTGKELNFVAQLRVPIRVVENGLIEFDEVVLVEPGESGQNFGDAQFWDYVVVEASKDNGASWIPLADGYDSGDKQIWSNRYTTGLSGQNSSSTGDSGILQRRSINLHQPDLGINSGDEVLLRWRLFSDAFAVGWGWMIDDLVIQGNQNSTPVVEYDASDTYISIFPNPVTENHLTFTVNGNINIHKMMISDSNGRLITQNIERIYLNDQKRIDLTALRPGVYFILFQTDKELISKRFLKL